MLTVCQIIIWHVANTPPEAIDLSIHQNNYSVLYA